MLSLNSYSFSTQFLYLPAVFLSFSRTTSPHFMFLTITCPVSRESLLHRLPASPVVVPCRMNKTVLPKSHFLLKGIIRSESNEVKWRSNADRWTVCGGVVVLSLCDWEVWGVGLTSFLAPLGFRPAMHTQEMCDFNFSCPSWALGTSGLNFNSKSI